jgi:hypothetical protein
LSCDFEKGGKIKDTRIAEETNTSLSSVSTHRGFGPETSVPAPNISDKSPVIAN